MIAGPVPTNHSVLAEPPYPHLYRQPKSRPGTRSDSQVGTTSVAHLLHRRAAFPEIDMYFHRE